MRRSYNIALAYDFDGTLAPGNMQEHSFIPNIRISAKKFWELSGELTKKNQADRVLTYMNLMLKKAKEVNVPVRRQDFIDHGKKVRLFRGVKTWFSRINKIGTDYNLNVEHYIISSGLREMIEGTPISGEFKQIYASSYCYDSNNVAEWPATALNYTTKTQFLFRINKGALNICDEESVNKYVPMGERPIPFNRIIFVGDGETDIPCFSLVKNLGGHSIAVYKPKTKGAKSKAQKLVREGRVNFIAPADYSKSSRIEHLIEAIMLKIATDCLLDSTGENT